MKYYRRSAWRIGGLTLFIAFEWAVLVYGSLNGGQAWLLVFMWSIFVVMGCTATFQNIYYGWIKS